MGTEAVPTQWIVGGFLGIVGILLLRREHQRRMFERIHRQQAEQAEAFVAAPVVNSHRVPCPLCGEWATLMVNAAGRQKRVCDRCGETYL